MNHDSQTIIDRQLRRLACCSALALLVGCGTGSGEGAPFTNVDDDVMPSEPPARPASPEDPSFTAAPPEPEHGSTLRCGINQSVCDGACINLDSDALNCGACGNGCGDGRTCSDGICNADTWLAGLEGDYTAGVRDVAVGPEGEIVVAGSFEGNLLGDFTSQGQHDVFVAKLDAKGSLVWLRTFGGGGNEEATRVAIDSKGSIGIAGRFDSTLSIESELVSHGMDDIFVAVLSPEGDPKWSHSYGDALLSGDELAVESQRPTALAFDHAGELVLAGVFSGDLAIGGEVLQGMGDEDTFVAKIDPEGQPRWLYSHTGPGDQVIADLAVDSDDSVVLMGSYLHKLSLGSFEVVADAQADGFIAKIDNLGNVRWLESFGDAAAEQVVALAIDPQNDEIVVSAKADLPYLLRFDKTGAKINDLVIPSFDALISDIAIDQGGYVWLSGSLNGELDAGLGTMHSDSEDALVLLYDAAFQPKWSHRYGDDASDRAVAIAATGAAQAVIAGQFTSSFDAGADQLICSASNSFVAGLSL